MINIKAKQLKTLPRKITLRGREFGQKELRIIRRLCIKHFTDGRTRISVEICIALNWRQHNGWLKDRACRDVLRVLYKNGFIKLPQPLTIVNNRPKHKRPLLISPAPHELITSISAPPMLVLVKGTKRESEWNDLVNRYHYLGHSISVGKCLKFLVTCNDTVLGAISLSECSWAVKARDNALSMLGIMHSEVANNNRFLILPHVRVKNLASRVLALLCTKAIKEWEIYYALKLKCLETFVDDKRFTGASYKAANWVMVGKTQGYRKSGSCHFNTDSPKCIYLYPIISSHRNTLRHTLRNQLTGE